MGSFTLNWADVYHFMRCPKILAFHVAGRSAGATTTRVSRRPAFQPNVIGTIGETATSSLLDRVTRQLARGIALPRETMMAVANKIYREALRAAPIEGRGG